jgi:cytochrome c-type biogenesis protein CcmH
MNYPLPRSREAALERMGSIIVTSDETHCSDAVPDEGEGVQVRNLFAIVFIAMLAGFTASAAYAVLPDEIMPDPAKEARARDLSRELRCMVCQNQSIDDSEAPLARDLRLLVRERIAAGDSDAQVLDFLVARYGEFVLLKPRLEGHTLLLWMLPPFALIVGGLALSMHARRRTRLMGDDGSVIRLSAEEEARLERLLAEQPLPDQPA